MTQLNALEREVLEKSLVGEHPVLEVLRRQLSTCAVKHRKLTGVGFFTELEVDQGGEPAPTSEESVRIGDVLAEMDGLRNGAGFILFVKNGFLDMLEGYTFDEKWPKEIERFETKYESGGARDLGQLKL